MPTIGLIVKFVSGLVLLKTAFFYARALLWFRIDSMNDLWFARVADCVVGLMFAASFVSLFAGSVSRANHIPIVKGAIAIWFVVSGSLLSLHEWQVQVRMASGRTQGINNLKQTALALHAYHDEHKKFPSAAICDKHGKPLLSWRVAILPYIEQEPLFKQFKLDEPWDSAHNIKLLQSMPETYIMPTAASLKPGETYFRVLVGGGAGFEMSQALQLSDIKDGTSNTIMVVEAADSVPWTKPDELNYDPIGPLPRFGCSSGRQYFFAAFFDGSIQSLPQTVSEKTLRALITRAAGDEPGNDY